MDDRVLLPVNTVLDGAYRIARVVGSGGFGITYEAEDIKLNARIAIKEYYPCDFGIRDAGMVVKPKSQRHKETFDWGRANFLEEARTLARFEHPSIVRVSRVFETNATAYMVMRFEQGRSFEGWLQGLGRPPTQAELDAILAPLLDALEIMHAQRFLHRDIAPDNIIIRTDNTPVLLDFGAARRAVAERSRALTGIVKAGYSPQEQYASDGRLQGPWSDFYALGGTLYRAVTGTVPEEATLRVSDDRTRPAAEIAKGTYRPQFLAAIDRCLRVRYSDRPQSVGELRPLLLGTAPPAPASRPQPPPPRTHPGSSPVRSAKPARPAAPQAKAASGAGRTVIIAAMLVLLGGAYAGYEYTRWVERDRAAQSAAKRDAESAAQARRKAEDDAAKAQAAARAKEDQAAAAKRQADEEARRAADDQRRRADAEAERRRTEEDEARRKTDRQAEIEAAKKKTEDDRRLREEEEERRRADFAERERRRVELAKAAIAFDGVWEITRTGNTCFTGSPVFGVTIENGGFAQGYGSVTPAGDLKFQGRSKTTGPRDLNYVGRLTGNSGSGTFQTDTGCTGTFTARRR